MVALLGELFGRVRVAGREILGVFGDSVCEFERQVVRHQRLGLSGIVSPHVCRDPSHKHLPAIFENGVSGSVH